MKLLPRLGFYMFCAALILAPLLGGAPGGSEYALAAWGGDGVSGALRALVLAAMLLALSVGDPPSIKPTVATAVARLGVYGAAVCVAVSLFWHSRGFTSQVYLFAMLPETLNWLVFAATFALAARFTAQDKADASRMATALLVGGVLCAVVGVLAFGAVPGAERAAHREAATFFSPNFAGGFAALLLPVAVALFLFAEGLPAVAMFGAAVGLLFGLLMITGSRASFGLSLAGLAVAALLALVRKARLPWSRVAAAVAVLALFGVVFSAPMLGRVAGVKAAATADAATGGDHSGSFRKETWRGTAAMAMANPVVGTGPGTFAFAYSRYARVAWTGHAHNSYLQLAAESGFVALLALLVGVGGSLGAGVKSGAGTTNPVLVPALLGGVVAALGRSVFDSEWILLACGVPFFAMLGMLAGHAETAPDNAAPVPTPTRIGNTVFIAATLVLTLLLRAGQSERDTLVIDSQSERTGGVSGRAKEAAGRIKPADPQVYALAGDYATAAFLSPSGRRLYQLARATEREGDLSRAVQTYKEAAAADPQNQQTRKALAEVQGKAGSPGDALFTYLDMIRIAESDAGRIRALPELVDTLPVFAYTAIGEDALKRGDAGNAVKNFRAAQQVVEAYSNTAPQYQLAEAATLGANTETRRAEVRDLYAERVMPGLRAALKKAGETAGADVSPETEAATLERLAAFTTGRAAPK